jgi:predicted transcriptional regulator
MHSISIAIPTEAADRLRELARRERRSPRQQAAVLVIAALERDAETPAAVAKATPGRTLRQADGREDRR